MIPRPGRLVLLGHPVGHSLSPYMHDAALAAADIPLRYEPLDVDPPALEAVVGRLRVLRAAGNVTVPYKERMYALCDRHTALAQRVGAVNVFWTEVDGALVGDNTDVGGFHDAAEALLGGIPPGLTVGVLGAGGAAAAVLAAVERWPSAVAHVHNRTPERARILCERFGSFAHPVDDVGTVAGAQLVVNATSVGLANDELPIDPALIPDAGAVMDLIPTHAPTRFVRELRARGIRVADGLPMLVEQAALAFERWFGLTAPRAIMRDALDRVLRERSGPASPI